VGTSKITGGQGSHNKPTGCGASGAYAPGPDDDEEISSDGAFYLMLTNPTYHHFEENTRIF
jgi:hypothetical protein